MNPLSTAEAIGHQLQTLGDPGRAVQEKRYLKSALPHLGVSVPAIRKVAKGSAPGLDRRALLALIEELWGRRVHEHRMCAVELLNLRSDLLGAEDFGLLERLLRESRTWALVDNLAAHVVGALVARHPSLAETLDRWALDEDFWVRRSALLALLLPLRRGEGDFERFGRYADAMLLPLRRGEGDFERFGRYADAMLEEREFFIRKAIGWVLRETGKQRPELVRDWLLPRARRAAGLTVREAIRPLPEADRAAILAARGDGRS